MTNVFAALFTGMWPFLFRYSLMTCHLSLLMYINIFLLELPIYAYSMWLTCALRVSISHHLLLIAFTVEVHHVSFVSRSRELPLAKLRKAWPTSIVGMLARRQRLLYLWSKSRCGASPSLP